MRGQARHSRGQQGDAPPPPLAIRATLRHLLPYLTEFPLHVTLAMALLVIAKISGVWLPLILKRLVDQLSPGHSALLVIPVALLIAYGGARFLNVLFAELRDLMFTKVGERAQRRAALRVFEHLHRLDLEFHLSRRTGGLSRDIEKGVEGINFLLRIAIFNILPTLFELALVTGILWGKYDARFALIALVSVAVYVTFSVVAATWRKRYLREVNRLDSSVNAREHDALINYETVKYFGHERFEAGR